MNQAAVSMSVVRRRLGTTSRSFDHWGLETATRHRDLRDVAEPFVRLEIAVVLMINMLVGRPPRVGPRRTGSVVSTTSIS